MYRINSRAAVRAMALLLLIGAVACKKKEEAYPPADTTAAVTPAPAAIHVAGIDVGKGINTDKTVKNTTDNFGVRDTIYASVKTEGASSAGSKLAAKWTFQDGQTVNETSTDIAPNEGQAIHEFHISKATAWPKGNYKVEILLDGTSAGTKDFSVK